jgi:hypothetical protein
MKIKFFAAILIFLKSKYTLALEVSIPGISKDILKSKKSLKHLK